MCVCVVRVLLSSELCCWNAVAAAAAIVATMLKCEAEMSEKEREIESAAVAAAAIEMHRPVPDQPTDCVFCTAISLFLFLWRVPGI